MKRFLGWLRAGGLALGLLSALASAQPLRSLEDYRIKLWNGDSAPQGTINALARTPDGYLWVATYDGLFRLDGVRFTTYKQVNTPALPNNLFRVLLVDRAGCLWIGGHELLVKRDAQGFHRIPLTLGTGDQVRGLAQDAQGRIWFRTNRGLGVWNGQQERFHPVPLAPVQSPDLIMRPDGGVILTAAQGLVLFQNNQLAPLPPSPLEPGELPLSLAQSPDGSVWVGCEQALYKLAEKASQKFTAREGLPFRNLSKLFLEPSGTLWITSANGGMLRFHDGEFEFPSNASFQRDRLVGFLADPEGSLWLATYGSGLVQLTPSEHFTAGSLAGFPERVRCLFRDRLGTLWLGTNGQGLWAIRKNQTKMFDQERGLRHTTLLCLAGTPDGSLWAGTYGALYRIEQDRVSLLPSPWGRERGNVRTLLRDHQDRMWVAVEGNGLEVWEHGHVTTLEEAGGASLKQAFSLVQTPDRAVWVGTIDGLLFRLEGKAAQVFGKEAGLQNSVYGLAADPEGGLWMATRAEGLVFFRDGHATLLGPAQGLPRVSLLGVLTDREQGLWVRTQEGLYRATLAELRAVLRGGPPAQPRLYGRNEGSSPTSGTGQPWALEDESGRLAFESSLGLIRHPAVPTPPNPSVPNVLIEGIHADGKPLDTNQAFRWNGGKLEIEYTATSFLVPEKVRFQYRLEGFDPEWVEADTRRKAFYTAVPPGSYVFHVRACNDAGLWNETGAAVALRLAPRFYQAWWFKALWGGVGLALFWALIRWRLRALRAAKIRLEATVEARTSDLRELAKKMEERNLELELLDRTLQEINRETSLTSLLNALLARLSALFPHSDAGVFLLRDPDTDLFHYPSTLGLPPGALAGVTLSKTEVLTRYTQGSVELEPGVYLVADLAHAEGYLKLGSLRVPSRILAMPLWVQGELEGVLGLGSLADGWEIGPPDAQRLVKFREHMISAIEKARSLERFQTEKERAESATQAKSAFLANMSHEIRTPMNAIQGFSQLGLKLELEERPRDYFQKIVTASKSLLGIINDILDFSKIEAGKLELEAVPFNLTTLLGNVTDLFAQSATEHGLELVLDLEPGLPTRLIGDPLRLGQVLINLVSNAMKFTSEGQVVLRVETQATLPAKVSLLFTVQDSGIGMSTDQAERLFKAFSQADHSTTRKFGGTGLGLVISQRLVHLMGGEIRVESEPGRGSTFTFSAGFGREAERTPAPLPKPLSVLVVDDHPTARTVLEAQLRHLGCTVALAGNGEEALARVQQQAFNVVFMDWRMPGLDGIATTRRLHGLPGHEIQPIVIMVTAHAREAIWPQAQEAGIRNCLLKPVSPELLHHALAEAMGWEENPPPAAGAEASATGEALKGVRILLVEDNPINQEVATEVLRGWSAEPRIASSGPEALRILEGEAFDVVLMDVQMPEMDGYETTGRIRQMAAHLSLPILAMTANAMEQDRIACLEAGMNDFIAKPIEPDELLAALRRWGKREVLPAPAAGPPAAAAESAVPLWELKASLRRLGGNEGLLQRLLEDFRQEQAGVAEGLAAALQVGDPALAERLAHTLKGVAGNLGARRLQEAAGQVERTLREGGRPDLHDLGTTLAATLRALPPRDSVPAPPSLRSGGEP